MPGSNCCCISELFLHLRELPQIPIWTIPDGRMELMYSLNFYSVTEALVITGNEMFRLAVK